MSVRPLPPNADLDHLKHQAKDLMRERKACDPQAGQRIREFHPRFHSASDADIFAAPFRLSDAQLTIARERGFANWARLRRRVEEPRFTDDLSRPLHERIDQPVFRRAVDLLDAGDIDGLRTHLRAHPDLIHQRTSFEGENYFNRPTLLEFVAENPIRYGKLPTNIVEVARFLIDTGAKENQSALDETLLLVCSGRIPRECGVQVPLIDLLCAYGADLDGALQVALVHGELEAVAALLRNGAASDLAAAVVLGEEPHVRNLLATANTEQRHRALALSAQFGRTEMVRLLLDAGEKPDRYNPLGFHAHSTPLHQAALAGHDEVVRLLVERGAKLDIKDAVYQGTPEDWARYAGKTVVADYLRTCAQHSKPL
jgi:FOG: Ankyrin repeat